VNVNLSQVELDRLINRVVSTFGSKTVQDQTQVCAMQRVAIDERPHIVSAQSRQLRLFIAYYCAYRR